MTRYAVDLRNRKTGNSEQMNVFVSDNHEESYQYAKEYNEMHVDGYNDDLDNEKYIDGKDGLFADVYLEE